MLDRAWFEGIPASITVCDAQGVIIGMNEEACKQFAEDGGRSLIGKNVLDCHPEPARSKLREMLSNKTLNCYTIEKNGARKLVYQTPWYQNNEYKGFIEMILDVPAELPNYKR